MQYFGLWLLLTVTMVHAKTKGNGTCWQFPGNTFLEFTPNNLNISHNAHFRFLFKTSQRTGILMYAEGNDDFEAVFLSNGKLIYLLTNPSPSGVEGTTGGVYQSNSVVNNNTWLQVDVWRNWDFQRVGTVGTELKTGMILSVPGSNRASETHTDNLLHRGVTLKGAVFFGGISPMSRHAGASTNPPPKFVGTMKAMYEERNDLFFENYNQNEGEFVQRCTENN